MKIIWAIVGIAAVVVIQEVVFKYQQPPSTAANNRILQDSVARLHYMIDSIDLACAQKQVRLMQSLENLKQNGKNLYK